MGCDIHAYLEYFDTRAGKWKYAGLYCKSEDGGFEPVRVLRDRFYGRFARMAGVRGELPEGGIEPRGLPGDMSPEVAGEARKDGGDLHTPSWLTQRDILDRDVITRAPGADERDFDLYDLLEDGGSCFDPALWVHNPEHKRVVFWFDN